MPTTSLGDVDTALLLALRERAGDDGRAVAAARLLSHAGEHAGGWLLLAAAGGALDPRRRGSWWGAGAAVASAHAASVLVKRVVRRPRPDLAAAPALVGTPSRLSFPSSHAASTTAAAATLAPLLLGRRRGAAVGGGVVVAMGASRVLLGVHYPSDVLAGCATGLLTVAVARRLRGWRPVGG
ncbi:phosphatase PAP2 family protein [uncultured Pseudokineococcus sp.]|uniref:phosphatase PAP2 family protein n=1 Tax=uncultured Pseudokineococcus sp. TaxID=1642928 RepID=UPI002623DC3C|nr:phosphatase PAP2 family protein [uncultured Pseudokineococcus sp.]